MAKTCANSKRSALATTSSHFVRSYFLVAAFGLLNIAANGAESLVADAAEKADWNRVHQLLHEGAAPTIPQVDGTTALHWAAYHDNTAVTKELLTAGVDAKGANRYGVSALSLACTNGSEEIVTALLDAGADPNTTLRGDESALMTAARTGRTGPVRALLARGANPASTDRKGQTALMWAAAEGHVEVVTQLLQTGADYHTRLKSGFNALLFAAREGRIEVVKTLLAAGADPNEVITTGKSGSRAPGNGNGPLSLAVENGHFELALALVKAGADPNERRSGFTPLHILTWVRRPARGDELDGQPPPDGSGNVGSLDFARRLVAAGANVNARLDAKGPKNGKFRTASATPFFMAAKTADLDYLKLLVELGADPNTPNEDGATPLMTAAGLGCYAPDEEAGTESECIEVVNFLLKLGADVNLVDQNGETAMHGAAYKSLPKMVHFLAGKGANPEIWNQKNASGWTPLMIAEGFRPGNFKPSDETLIALHSALKAAGLAIPPPTVRTETKPRGYDSSTGAASEDKVSKVGLQPL